MPRHRKKPFVYPKHRRSIYIDERLAPHVRLRHPIPPLALHGIVIETTPTSGYSETETTGGTTYGDGCRAGLLVVTLQQIRETYCNQVGAPVHDWTALVAVMTSPIGGPGLPVLFPDVNVPHMGTTNMAAQSGNPVYDGPGGMCGTACGEGILEINVTLHNSQGPVDITGGMTYIAPLSPATVGANVIVDLQSLTNPRKKAKLWFGFAVAVSC